jgi:hypothetical protein
MRLKNRIKRMEKEILQKKEIPAIVIRYLDGNISWANQIFPNEEEFLKAIERAFKDEPPSPDPDVILINFRRETKDINAGKYGVTEK